ncbi:hypothetical protein KC19_1G266400 [Ceratodon purpureus]|uniref:Uncharacterized protein n=1 Tax=Ceratodon purpureus TaxID=3225 RepID=A0A8T0JBD5_CERPU|nr:hypothetical protein KC19_1G266400 [Ceratodon purpureus]
MEQLVESVEKLLHAETGTMVMRLELANLQYELQTIDVPALREELRDAQEEYEQELDVLSNLLNLFAPTRYRRGVIDVDRRLGRALQDVMTARAGKEIAFNRWRRGKLRAENLTNMISAAETELVNVQAVEQITREDCYAPILELARVYTSSRSRANSRG